MNDRSAAYVWRWTWRRRIRHFLIDHSRLYRRFIMWRFRRSIHRLERTVGRKLTPAFERASQAMIEWKEAWERANA